MKNCKKQVETAPCNEEVANETKNLEKVSAQEVIEMIQDNIVQDEIAIKTEVIEKLVEILKKNRPNYQSLRPETTVDDAIELFVTQNSLCDKLSEENQRIADILVDNPRLYLLISSILRGDSISVALVKSDLIDVMPSEDEEDYKEYIYALTQARERNYKAKELARQRDLRCEECAKVSDRFYSDIDASDDEIKSFVTFLDNLIDKIFAADIDYDFMETMWKAYNFENEIKLAHADGVVDGKNELIALRRRSSSDGLPMASASGSRMLSQHKVGYIERLLRNK